MEITIDKDYKIWSYDNKPNSPLFLWRTCEHMNCRWGLTTMGYTLNYTYEANHEFPPIEITNKLKFILPKFPGHCSVWVLSQALTVRDLTE